MGRTTIQVSDDLADELHERKNRGESYEDVIWRLIDGADTTESATNSPLNTLNLPPSEENAVAAAYEHLREVGTSQRSDFINEVYPDHHAGYSDRDLKDPERAWWKNVIDPNLRKLPGVSPPSSEGKHYWRFTGE